MPAFRSYPSLGLPCIFAFFVWGLEGSDSVLQGFLSYIFLKSDRVVVSESLHLREKTQFFADVEMLDLLGDPL